MEAASFFDTWLGWGVIVVANFPVYWLNYYLLFKDVDELLDAFFMTLQPDWISWSQGELAKDWWLSTKFGIFMALNIAIVGAEIYLITEYLLK